MSPDPSWLGAPHIIALGSNAEADEVDVQVSRLAADEFRKATEIIFRVPSAFIEPFAGRPAQAARRAAHTRAGGKPLFLLTYFESEMDFGLFLIGRDGLDRIADAKAIERIRCADLASLIHNSGETCYSRSTNTYHFVTPSGWHTGTFIRVADAIRSLDCLDRMAFWLLPPLARADAVLIDTWSMSTPILRAAQMLGRHLPFDCLSAHPEKDETAVIKAIEHLRLNAKEEPSLACIISLTSSGSLMTFISRILGRRASAVKTNFYSIYCFIDSPAEVKAMCRLPESAENYASKEECVFCKSGSTPLLVDPRLYYIRSPQETEVPLRREYFDAPRRFLDVYGGIKDILRVHRDDANDQRHHAFEVDVIRLLGDPGFIGKYKDMIAALPERPDVVVAPDHEAGRFMARIASGLMNSHLVVHNDLRPQNGLRGDDIRTLNRAERILVVDDVLNSGTRLGSYNRAIREHFGHISSVSFLVGLARPRSAAEWHRHEVALTRHHPWHAQLAAVEAIYLSQWDSKACPWCREYDFLSGISEKLAQPPEWLRQRLTTLAGRDLGINGEPLLILPGASSQALGQGSPVAPHGSSAMTVLFSMASALEALRNDTDEKRRLWPHFPDFRVFAVRNLENYSEGLLEATLLRLVQPHEWGDSKRDQLAERIIQQCGLSDQSLILGEALLSYGHRVLPLSFNTFSRIFGESLGDLTGDFFGRGLR